MPKQIKFICNEDDYQKALKRVEYLWGAKIGTPVGTLRELEKLLALIEEYESKHYIISSMENPMRVRQKGSVLDKDKFSLENSPPFTKTLLNVLIGSSIVSFVMFVVCIYYGI